MVNVVVKYNVDVVVSVVFVIVVIFVNTANIVGEGDGVVLLHISNNSGNCKRYKGLKIKKVWSFYR